MKRLLISLIVFSSVASGEIPSCESSGVRDTVKQIIKDASLRFIDLQNVMETGYNREDQIRSCAGNLATMERGAEYVQYIVRLPDKGVNAEYWVEFLNPEQDNGQMAAKEAIKQYELVKASGRPIFEVCLQLGAITQLFLWANDESQYKLWQDKKTEECKGVVGFE